MTNTDLLESVDQSISKGKSHFPIDLGVLTAIRQLIEPNSTIVELGSGNGTNRLVQDYTVYSIEDDAKWIGYCEGTNYIHAPLVNLHDEVEATKWYDPEIIKVGIPEHYDLVLVDGPAGKKGRTGLLSNLDIFRKDVPFIIDDTLRNHECQIARDMAYLLNRPLYLFWNFSIISPTILTEVQIARIQTASLQVLEKEESPYLLNYFSRVERIIEPNIDELEQIIDNFNKKSSHLAGLELDRRRLSQIETSISLRLGRFLTSPLRFLNYLVNHSGNVKEK